ncbi:MAG TPA: ATP synthase F1 subunit delta [Gaiellaceae bacterium]
MAVVHRIYAQALLDAARDQGSLPAVREEFADFAASVQESDELRGLLRNPQIDPRAKRDILDELLEGGDESFRNFMRLLAEKNRLPEVLDVFEEWERLLAAEERVLEVEIATAVELSDEEAAEIVGQIEKAAGRKVEATRTVDPDLIGGIVLQAGSRRADGSVRGRLNELREDLLQRT